LGHHKYAAEELWNLIRLVDLLEADSRVEKSRIGCAGLSMGGEWAMWLAACDLRIKAAVISGWMCTTEGALRIPNCPCWRPDGLLTLCDIAEVNALIAPRPVLFESAESDQCFPVDATVSGFAKIRRAYELLETPDLAVHHTFPGDHRWNGGKAYAFMETHNNRLQ
jgi:dienelactone hydrolase